MTDTPTADTTTSRATVVHRPVDIPALTGVRAVAAVIVVAHHMRAMVNWFAPGPIADAIRPVLDAGVPSLDVFFLLSGFVIAHNYAHRLTAPRPGAWRDYVIARVARIYPLHVVGFLLFCLVLAAGALGGMSDPLALPHTAGGFVANLFMLQGMPGVTPWNYPSWSLTGEFAMYLVFPLFAVAVLKIRWKTAAVVAALALCLQLYVMFRFGADNPGSTLMGWPRVAGEFTAGAMAWVIWHHRLRPGLWGDAVVVLCTAAAWWLMLNGYVWLWTVPLFAIMIPAIACATGPVGKLLAHPITQWGGRLSFAVYLVHTTVFYAAIFWVIPADMYVHHSHYRAALVLGGIFVACWVFGALLHHGVEEPARRWILRRSAQRTAKRAPQPVPATVATAGHAPPEMRA